MRLLVLPSQEISGNGLDHYFVADTQDQKDAAAMEILTRIVNDIPNTAWQSKVKAAINEGSGDGAHHLLWELNEKGYVQIYNAIAIDCTIPHRQGFHV